MRLAGYIRVSTEDQAKEGFSLENQRDKESQFCSSKSMPEDPWVLVEIYQDDSTGRNVDRPGYQRMLAERDKWDAIVVVKLDRIHRNQKNFVSMMEDLERWGKKFVSVQDSLDTSTAMGRFVMYIIMQIAQLESEQIGERVEPSMALAKKKGLHVGRPPVGFSWSKSEVKFSLTAWAKKLIEDVAAYGVVEAGRMNPYVSGKKTKGKPVSESAVRRILENFRMFEAGTLKPNSKTQQA